MNPEMIFTFALIGVAAILMASNKVRFDIVALMVVLALMLSGVLLVDQALAGFGSSVVILVAGLLITGEMLARTGVARAIDVPERAEAASQSMQRINENLDSLLQIRAESFEQLSELEESVTAPAAEYDRIFDRLWEAPGKPIVVTLTRFSFCVNR